MNLLIVSQYFYPESFRINDLAVQLVKRGHQVTVLSGTPNYPSGSFFSGYGWFKRTEEVIQGVRVIRVPVIPRMKGRGWQLALNYFSFAFFGSLLAPLKIRGKVDAILVYQVSPATMGIPAVVVKRLKSAKLFFWVQDIWPETLSAMGAIRSPFILRKIGSLVSWLYRQSDYVLGQSEAFLPAIIKRGVPSNRALYFPNSAEALYRPVEKSSATEVGAQLPQGFKVMFAGNIGIAQDIESIVKAAEILKKNLDVKWIIIGQGSMHAWLRQEIINRGLENHIFLLGQHPVDKMPEFFSQADLLLATLKKDPIFEKVIPSKIQSYLACGKAIVASIIGGHLRKGNDILINVIFTKLHFT
ncbi:MAG: glycosyltransferase WbuB [Chitinophagaceae bacterium]|nr:MAG: glycosyltransferase WbuB [Chitinophagaceae bacterium]